MKVKKINHVAIAVENIAEALKFWQDALGIQLHDVEDVPNQNAKVAFLPLGESEIELVEPTNADSGTAKFIREKGPGMHHLCLEVENIDLVLMELKKKDIRLINESPIELEGRKMAFIHPKSTGGVLLELYELIS